VVGRTGLGRESAQLLLCLFLFFFGEAQVGQNEQRGIRFRLHFKRLQHFGASFPKLSQFEKGFPQLELQLRVVRAQFLCFQEKRKRIEGRSLLHPCFADATDGMRVLPIRSQEVAILDPRFFIVLIREILIRSRQDTL